MATVERKRVTLHPLKEDGTVNPNICLYPKTFIDGIVNKSGKEVEVQEKLIPGIGIEIKNNVITATGEVDAYTKEEADEKFATKEEISTLADNKQDKIIVTAADAGKIVAVDNNGKLSLVEALSSGTKLYKHILKFGIEGAEGQSYISFINNESSQYTPESFLSYLSALINGNRIMLPLTAGWSNTALSTTEVFNYSMSALLISQDEIGIRVIGHPAMTVNTSSLDAVIYNDFTQSEIANNFTDTVTEL